ncbi:MAG: GAF domain-containing protein [Chloroflexi bacterium]|nr:GAF domain-containing protein [Chloroflexota bacterium]
MERTYFSGRNQPGEPGKIIGGEYPPQFHFAIGSFVRFADGCGHRINQYGSRFYLVGRPADRAVTFAASSGPDIPGNVVVPMDSSIAGWVVRNGRSLILDDVQTDDRFYANVDQDLQFHTRAMLAVPLITGKGVIGCLEVINKNDASYYTSQDVALMEALAAQAAVAILNAHLFNQSDLLAEIMHELKTPLMAITTASELLIRPDLPENKRSDVVAMIQRETKRLLTHDAGICRLCSSGIRPYAVGAKAG